MLSFYGGQNGQSFTIKQVFNNCTALVADLTDVNSPVEIDEYVTIFYGKPGSLDYQINFDTDNPSEEEIGAGAVKYGNRNASFWKKVYKLEDEIKKLDGIEKLKYLSATDTNVRYYNLGYFSANTPVLEINSTTGIAPDETPEAKVNSLSTPDKYILDFCIPEARSIYCNDYIEKQYNSDKSLMRVKIKYNLQLIEKMPRKGDYYINPRNDSYYLITQGPTNSGDGETFILTLSYLGQFNYQINENVLVNKTENTYIDNNQTLAQGTASFEYTINPDNEKIIDYQTLKISLPSIPTFSANAETVQDNQASVVISNTSNDLNFNFKIPQGEQGVQGPVGPGFDIINMIEVTGTNENINETIVAKLNQLYTTKPESTQIIGVNYIDSSTGNVIASYWYCWTQNAWHSINAFGGSNLSWKEF